MFLVRHLESLCLSTVWHSEQHFKFGIQSLFLVWISNSLFVSRSAFSHHISFNLAFRFSSSVWCSESLFVSSSAFKAVISFFRLAFKVMSSVWHSESRLWRSESHLQSSYFLHFSVQSRLFLVWHLEPSYP